MIVKLLVGTELRRFSIPDDTSFHQFITMLHHDVFARVTLTEPIAVQYVDSDGDIITVGTEEEFLEATRLALIVDRPSSATTTPATNATLPTSTSLYASSISHALTPPGNGVLRLAVLFGGGSPSLPTSLHLHNSVPATLNAHYINTKPIVATPSATALPAQVLLPTSLQVCVDTSSPQHPSASASLSPTAASTSLGTPLTTSTMHTSSPMVSLVDNDARMTASLCLSSSVAVAADVDAQSCATSARTLAESDSHSKRDRLHVQQVCLDAIKETSALQKQSHEMARQLVNESTASTTRAVANESAHSLAQTTTNQAICIAPTDPTTQGQGQQQQSIQQSCTELSTRTASEVTDLSNRTKTEVDASSDDIVAAIRAL